MREIKFRALNTKTGFWFEQDELVFCGGNWYEDWRRFEDGKHLNMRDCAVMQYTGLKDKNGVEIYEGDIVQSTWYDVDNNLYKKKGEITYAGAQYVIAYDSQFDVETGEITYDAHSLTYAEDAEVIGNIYENSDLLEENDWQN